MAGVWSSSNWPDLTDHKKANRNPIANTKLNTTKTMITLMTFYFETKVTVILCSKNDKSHF